MRTIHVQTTSILYVSTRVRRDGPKKISRDDGKKCLCPGTTGRDGTRIYVCVCVCVRVCACVRVFVRVRVRVRVRVY